MSNTIFEQWYEDMYGEKTFPNISDERKFKEACTNAYLFGLQSEWNYNISEAPRDGTSCLFIVKGYRPDDISIRKLRFGCINEYRELYYELSLDRDEIKCFSCKHIGPLTYNEDGYAVKKYSERCEGCIVHQILAWNDENKEYVENPILFENKFTTEEELEQTKKEFLNKYGVYYYHREGYDSYDEVSFRTEQLVAWKRNATIPEHLKDL